jgi:hypothetical protein
MFDKFNPEREDEDRKKDGQKPEIYPEFHEVSPLPAINGGRSFLKGYAVRRLMDSPCVALSPFAGTKVYILNQWYRPDNQHCHREDHEKGYNRGHQVIAHNYRQQVQGTT